MEPYDDDAYIQKNIVSGCSEGTVVKHGPMLPFYPLVELGTAPIEVECIEDLQKVRPFGVNTNKNIVVSPHDTPTPTTGNATLGGHPAKDLSDSTASTDPVKITPSATLRKRESCLIESTGNSIRVSFLFKAQANAAAKPNADPLEASILFQWMRFLMVKEHHPLLRKKPLKGYSVTFLVTSRHLAIHGRQKVEDSILGFCAKIDKECSDIKLQVNAQARYVTTEFLKAFNNQTAMESGAVTV
jgi:actin related protein 2/3 complex subunit 4